MTSSETSFDGFSLLSIDPTTLLVNIKDWGKQNLDSVVCKTAVLQDKFPSHGMDNLENHETMSLFCFPEGVNLRIIPRCAENGAKRIGWLGENSDRYMLHVFHDHLGDASFGISITTKEEIILPNLSLLLLQRSKIRAANKILRCWRKYYPFKNKRKTHSRKKLHSLAGFFDNLKHQHNLNLNNSQEVALPIGSSNRFQVSGNDSGMLSTISRLTSTPSVSEETISVKHCDYLSVLSRKISCSEESKRLAKESYRKMIENFELGYMCVVEKCYIIVGTNPENNSLLFRGLKQLVDYEREDTTLFGTDEKISKRKQILKSMRKQIYKISNTETKVVKFKSEPKKKKSGELQLAPFLPTITYPVPPPLISHEWGLMRLVLRIKLPNVIVLMQLLLLERSILVIGGNYDEVTACTCSLLHLIEPFKWVSTFIPLLPTEMLGFVCSPVPFICGIVAETMNDVNRIEQNADVKQETMNGLNIVNLVTGRILVTKEATIERKIGFHFKQTV